MKQQRLPMSEVEARVRVAFLERSQDVEDLSEGSLSALRQTSRRRRRGARTILVPAAGLLLLAAAVALTLRTDRGADHVSAGKPRAAGAAALLCGGLLPFSITVPGSLSPVDGPAPGSSPPAEGQLVRHWPRAAGAVEVRWPAPAQPVYGSRSSAPGLAAGMTSSVTRADLDVDQLDTAADRSPDVAFERRPSDDGATEAPAPCDVLELTVMTTTGRWVSGVRPASPASGAPIELVDLQARIIERRSVTAAPVSAIRCQGSDQFGTPPNRSGGPDPGLRGTEPADVLLQYLAATPGVIKSGYVEMSEPDGSITYGVDASGDGWTTLLFVDRDGDAWFLSGWTASGC